MNTKTIPTTVTQCVNPDNVTVHLWKWAENLISIGIVSAIIIAISGVIVSFSAGKDEGVFLGLLLTALIAIAEYFLFFTISLLVNALANILYNTHISANIALLEAGNTSEIIIEKNAENNSEKIVIDKAPIHQSQVNKTTTANEWKCPKCGNIHQNYVGTCGCGEKKPR